MKKLLLYLSMLFLAFVCNVTPVNAQVVEVLKDVNPGNGSSVTSTWMTNHNGKLFYAADDGTHGMELWVSDGTDAGTTLLKDIRPGIDGSYAGYAQSRNNKFAVCNNKLFFIANDGNDGGMNSELFVTDGTTVGTHIVKDIRPDWGGLASAYSLYTYNGKVYFCGVDGDPYFGTEYHGAELWCSDGTEEGTYMVKDIMPNSSNYGSSGSNPQRFMEFNGMLYFVAYDGGQGVNGGHSSELWVTDGTEEGTHLFKDIAQEYYNETPSQLTVCGDLMFFTTRVGIYGTELWATDGTEEGTYMVKDIYPGEIVPGMPWHGNPTFLTNYNGTLFFQAWDEDGSCLWKSDGTENGTVKLSSVVHKPVNLKVYGDQIIFLAYDGSNSSNYELYSWSETAGVQLVKEINPSPTSGIDFNPEINFPEGFVEYKDKLYFRAADDGMGTTLWQTDGTESGTMEAPGQTGYPDPLNPMFIMEFNFQVFNGSLYYPAGYFDDPAVEIYKLTVAPIDVFAVTGSGDYCQGDEGLPVGLSGSEAGVTYTLYKNGVAQTPTIEGTGEAITFGNQTVGTYTVSGANVAGVLEMGGSAVVNTATSIPVSVSIVAEDEEVCAGVHVTFTAAPVNGGLYPDYLWYVNGEELGEGSTYTYFSWIPGEFEIYAKLTSSFSCAANVALSNVITLTINEFVTPEVTITASENPVYSADPVTFTPAPVNGGTPSYEWFVNNVVVGTDNTYTYLPINEDQVYVVMTSSVECASATTAQSNVIEMIVNNGIPAGYSVTGGGNYCEGTGGLPVGVSDSEIGVLYTLYKDGVAQSPTVEGTGEALSFGDQPGGVYTVTGTNANTTTAMVGSAVIIELDNLPVSVTVEPDHEPICSNSTIVFNAYAENVGDAPTFQWYKNGIAIEGFNFNQYQFVPIEGDEVYVVVTSSLECTINNPAISEVYELEVIPLQMVEVSIEADNLIVCDGTPVTFTATPVYGGTNPTYYWNVNDNLVSTTNEPTYTYIPAPYDLVYVLLNSDLPCTMNDPATSNYIYLTVNPYLTPAVNIIASENPVFLGEPVTFTPSPENGGDTPAYQWYVNGNFVSVGSLFTYLPQNGDEVYAIMTGSLACVTSSTATSNTIQMVVSDGFPVIVTNTSSLVQTINQLNGQATDYLLVSNLGEGILGWSATIEYLEPTKTVTVPEGPQIIPLDIDLSVSGIASASCLSAKDRETIVLNYDGENHNAIGLQSDGSFSVAARYPSNMTSPYAGYMLESVDVYINDAPSSASLKIWGAGTTTTPGTILLEQAFSGTGWLTIALTEPVEVNGSDIWVGYTVTHLAGAHPAGCDAGPANANGDWISTDGTNWDHLADLGYSSNWNIRANLTGVNYNWLSLDQYSGMVEANESQELLVYFDATGLSVNDLYTANILISSNDPATPVVTIPVALALTVGVDENELSGIEVYPNPTSGMLNIKIPTGINEIKMYNQFGQEMKRKNVNGQTSINWNLGMMPGGTYLLRFVNDKGKILNKRIIII